MRVRRVESRLRETVGQWGEDVEPARSAQAIYELVGPLIAASPVEVFGVVLLDGKHRATGWAECSRERGRHATQTRRAATLPSRGPHPT